MAVSVLVGIAAGLLLRSRWALLLAPVCFAAMFELTRATTAGPLVDGIHLSSEYGLVAFVTGRGFHGLITLVPLVLGAVVGAALARRPDRSRSGRSGWGWAGAALRGGTAGLSALLLVGLAAALAVPARTDPILGADGDRLPGSVAELVRVDVGGHDLSMMVRGQSTANPVLLVLAGGPGGTELGAMRNHGQALEEHFTVVTWDQRGAGKSADQLDPTSTITLRERFDADVDRLVAGLPPGTFVADVPYFMHGRWETDSAEAALSVRDRAGEAGLVVVPLNGRLRQEGLRAMLTQTSGDFFHPDDRGYRVWADAFWDAGVSSVSPGQ